MVKKKIKIALMYDKEQWADYLSNFYDIEFSDTPDYVLCESGTALECIYRYDCIRIIRHGENVRPDFNFFDYAMGFDRISFGDRYLYYPLYMSYGNDLQMALHKHELGDDFFLKKTNFCNFVVSNGNAADPARDRFFDLLNRTYKRVDSGGRYRNNLSNGQAIHDKLEFQKDYKFSIAFENSCYKGYTTEKLTQAFAAGTIPIYWGNPDVSQDFNEDSFVNCHSFATMEDVVDRVKEIDSDRNLYLSMQRASIVNEKGMIPQMLKTDYLESFLRNIFDQPLKTARRRTNAKAGWGYFAERDAKRLWEMYHSKLVRVAYKLSRMF